ncbi:hypothetical protein E2C01_071278 [Portunus trituberculatus]|uniref:Uncharacterized protein n=1 Tax=Portunus trituberculatus TaxID=210409 RepID=A0A5B7I400_PORTR|nr:hypothetical protein [Portunus trituberculatus]
MEGQQKFGEDTLTIKDSINILGVEVDSKLSFEHHLESMACKASLRGTLLHRKLHLLDTKGLMTLYKVQSHLSLQDKVQQRAEHLIIDSSGHRQELHTTQQQQQ